MDFTQFIKSGKDVAMFNNHILYKVDDKNVIDFDVKKGMITGQVFRDFSDNGSEDWDGASSEVMSFDTYYPLVPKTENALMKTIDYNVVIHYGFSGESCFEYIKGEICFIIGILYPDDDNMIRFRDIDVVVNYVLKILYNRYRFKTYVEAISMLCNDIVVNIVDEGVKDMYKNSFKKLLQM